MVLLLLFDIHGLATKNGTGNLSEPSNDPDGSLQSEMPNYVRLYYEGDYVVFGGTKIAEDIEFQTFFYTFSKNKKVFESLRNIYTGDLYAWDSRKTVSVQHQAMPQDTRLS